MIVEMVEIIVDDAHEAAFEVALCEVRQRVFMSAGFRGFSVVQGVDERPSAYLVDVRWESADELAAFTQHRAARAWAPIEPYLAAPLRVRRYVERPGLALTGPGVLTDTSWLTE